MSYVYIARKKVIMVMSESQEGFSGSHMLCTIPWCTLVYTSDISGLAVRVLRYQGILYAR